MATEPDGYSAEDREAIRLAKARLVRICRCDGAAAERALQQGAAEQHSALVSVAMRVLSASPEDLAAGRVVPASRADPSRRPPRAKGQKSSYRPPHGPQRPAAHKRPRRGPRKGRR